MNHISYFRIACLTVLCDLIGSTAFAQSVTAESDQWAFTDGTGRVARSYDEAGDRREDKFVGIFYWTWHQNRHNPSKRVVNVTKTVAEHPEALNDYNSPYWGGSQKPDVFFWGEPIYGYYQTTDKWVLRKHAEMLADAGVDVVFFDCTNGTFLWEDSFVALCEAWTEAQNDGVKVPKVAFHLPFSATDASLASLRNLYLYYYRPQVNKYSNLWFYWRGKPLILAYNENLTKYYPDDEIKTFFTFRPCEPSYSGGMTSFRWSWLQCYPQTGCYLDVNTMKFEQMSVGVAQNARPESYYRCCAFNLPGTFGRSYSKTKGFDTREDAYLYGWNFQEQWDRAIDQDPSFIFVTGWNEFHSGMWTSAQGWSDPLSFVDQFDWDHSRDCEPTLDWGDKGDTYYCHLVDQVRRFKGMAEPAEVSAPKTIVLNTPGMWDDVLPVYTAYKGNVGHRDHDGYCEKHYTNTTGRNDFVSAQVTHDDNFVYFRAETADPLTIYTSNNWMQLFIDVDRDKSTGWYGYDFVVNHEVPSPVFAYVSRNLNNRWQWTRQGQISFSALGKVIEFAIPKSMLGITGDVDIEFKWSDNMQDEGNIMDFYVNGDCAPGARFNYVYTSHAYSGIDDVYTNNAAGLKASAVAGGIFVETDGEFNVYGVSGSLVASGSGSQTVTVADKGLYIVNNGSEKIKIAVTK